MAEPTDAQRLAEANDILIGSIDNGPWVLIVDPGLRKVVGEYVADTCHSVALAAGLDEAMEFAHNTLPHRLDTTSKLLVPDARERLARHLWIVESGGAEHHLACWDSPMSETTRRRLQRRAEEIIAVITGQEN